jgi:hypothetical protein
VGILAVVVEQEALAAAAHEPETVDLAAMAKTEVQQARKVMREVKEPTVVKPAMARRVEKAEMQALLAADWAAVCMSRPARQISLTRRSI